LCHSLFDTKTGLSEALFSATGKSSDSWRLVALCPAGEASVLILKKPASTASFGVSL